MKLDGSLAVVTGAGSGLGAATARALAEAGCRVALFDLNQDAAGAVADELGGGCRAFGLDVADAAAGEAAFAQVEAMGQVRVLVNCAGVAPAARTVGKKGPMPLDAFERTVRVNLIGSFNTARLAAAAMARAEPLDDFERGVIVNTASIAAFEGQTGQAAYAASKGGVAAMTLPMARDLAPLGIRVVAIAPGIFATPMLAGLPQPVQDKLAEDVPFPHRLGRPEEFAALVRHVAENPMLNGEVIRLDGALRMPPG